MLKVIVLGLPRIAIGEKDFNSR